MKILIVFFQIILFPFSVLIISYLLNRMLCKPDTKVYKITAATNFSIMGYIVGGLLLFPLYFLFKPIKINNITYLVGNNLLFYWLISFIIITPLVIGLCSYIFYFKKVNSKNIIFESIIIGIYQVPLGWIFEIIIYVYWRKTIPTVYDYFFGKNYPWIMINWLIGAFIPLIIGILIKKEIIKKNNVRQHST